MKNQQITSPQKGKSGTVMEKRAYVPPTVEVTFIEMEGGIAGGSGLILPVGKDEEITNEWVEGGGTDVEMGW